MAREKKQVRRYEWQQLLPIAALTATVVLTLLMGAALRDDSRNPVPSDSREVTLELDADPAGGPSPNAGPTVPATRYEPPVAEPSDAGPSLPAPGGEVGDALIDRTTEDQRRLGASGDGWTLQFSFLCDAANVRPLVDALADEPDFYLLTQPRDEKICFRICWGFYPSKERALAARDVPKVLRDLQSRPQPLPVSQVLG